MSSPRRERSYTAVQERRGAASAPHHCRPLKDHHRAGFFLLSLLLRKLSTAVCASTSQRKMYRRSLGRLAKQTDRILVRDPRNSNKPKVAAATVSQRRSEEVSSSNVAVPTPPPPPPVWSSPQQQQQRPVLPFEPSAQNQQSVGSTLGSYMLAGFGMGLGMILVRVVLGF